MPMQRNLYPRHWKKIARRLKEAANWTCQRCGARRGDQQQNRHGQLVDVQIGVAHLDHDPWNSHARLEVMCRRCHIAYDAHDARRKRVMMAIARGQLILPGLRAWYQPPRLRSRRKEHRRPRVTIGRRQRPQKKEVDIKIDLVRSCKGDQANQIG